MGIDGSLHFRKFSCFSVVYAFHLNSFQKITINCLIFICESLYATASSGFRGRMIKGLVIMIGMIRKSMGREVAGVLVALSMLAAPVALYADASAPWAKHRVMKKKHRHVARKRRAVAKPMAQPAPEPAYVPPPEPVYTPPPEPVYTPPAPAPTPPAPVAAAPKSGFPAIAVLGGLAAIGAIIALAGSGGSNNSTSP
jgi:hypothetical protein